MRERLLMLKGHFRFADWEPDAGPGRTDTFNPAKTLLEFHWKNSKRASWLAFAIFRPSG